MQELPDSLGVSPGLQIATEHVWLGAAALGIACSLAVFVALLAGRYGTNLLPLLGRADAWLAAHAPRAHRWLQRAMPWDRRVAIVVILAVAWVVGLSMLFAELTESWMNESTLYRLDRAVHEAFARLETPAALGVLGVVTYLGSFGAVLVGGGAMAAWLAWKRDRYTLVALLVTILGGEALVWILKIVFGRDRPGGGITDPAGDAFPSAHTFTATILVGFAVYLLWRHLERTSARWLVSVVAIALVMGVGLSRIMLSVHWTSDVLGGLVIGMGWLVVSLLVGFALRHYRERGHTAPPSAAAVPPDA